MAAQNSVEIEIHSPTTCVIMLIGEHDASSGEALSLVIALARGYANVLVDLSQCDFADTTLVNALLMAAKRAREREGALELVVPAEASAVRRILALSNVQRILPFHPTRAAGLASIASVERLAVHHDAVPALHIVNAKIETLQADTEAGRAVRVAKAHGRTVLRALVADDADVPHIAHRPANPDDQDQRAA